MTKNGNQLKICGFSFRPKYICGPSWYLLSRGIPLLRECLAGSNPDFEVERREHGEDLALMLFLLADYAETPVESNVPGYCGFAF